MHDANELEADSVVKPRTALATEQELLSREVADLRAELLEWKRRAEQAEAAKHTLDAVLACVPVGVVVVDAKVATGAPVTSKFGNTTLWDRVPLDSLEHTMNRSLRKVVTTGEHVVGEELLVCLPNGDQVPVVCDAVPIRDAQRKVTGAVVAWRDIADRKASEAAAQRSETRLRLLVDNMPSAYCLCRLVYSDDERLVDAVCEEVNAAFARLMRSEPIGRRLTELLPGMRRAEPELMTAFQHVACSGAPKYFEIYFEGLERWYHIAAYSPEPGHVAAIFDDITERKRTEDALRVSERIYRAIGESIDYGIWICAPDGRNTYASQSFLDLVGITQEECSNFGWGNILHPDDAERTIAAWKECVARLDKWDIEHSYRRVDGSYHPILARGVPVRNAQGEVECWAGINLDIGALKATEAHLLGQKQRLALLSSTASRLLAAEDPLSVVQDLCSTVMQHLDCQVFFNFIADSSMNRLRLNAWSGIDADEARRIEWLDYGVAVCGRVALNKCRIIAEHIQQSTDPLPALVRSYGVEAYCCHPLLVEGRTLGTLSFGTRTRATFSSEDVELMRTVADQVAAAMQRLLVLQELSKANAQLREADQHKSQFLAILSHELRNPLTPIKNCLYLLERCGATTDQATRARQTIERQVTQLSRLVDDLLEVTRLTSGKLRLDKSRIDLADVAQRTADDHRGPFEKAGVSLEVQLAVEGPLLVEADSSRIGQAIGNLLTNACKFTPPGGSVVLAVDQHNDESAEIRVSDTGVGISPEMLVRLFEPFVQADSSLDRSRGGLGLGLSLVRGIIEMHGGSVDAHSDGVGAGSVFTLRLPLIRSALAASDGAVASERAPRRRVLVVEDNVDAAESLRELLEFGGHHVELAHDGPDGVEKARSFRPEVVLCDIGLPGFDGYTVAQQLRADPRTASVHLVALSGYAQQEDVRHAMEAGFDGHIAKPPTLEQIDDALGVNPMPD
jgi:PAS domain S-box-containing protein